MFIETNLYRVIAATFSAVIGVTKIEDTARLNIDFTVQLKFFIEDRDQPVADR